MNEDATVRELLAEGTKRLEAAGIEEAALDAELLLEKAAEMNRAAFRAFPDRKPGKEAVTLYESMLAEREKRIPLQHICGEQYFYGLRFICDGRALIPRADTEILVEAAAASGIKGKRVLDLCTGSGCIAVSLKKAGGCGYTAATDLSEEALTLAKENALLNSAEISFYRGDLYEALPAEEEAFDVIVSNPPYIESAVIGTLMPEVRDHDPLMALDGGADGRSFYRRIAAGAGSRLVSGGRIFLETGCEQGEQVSAILAEAGFEDIRVIKDYAGLDRVVSARWRNV